MQQQIAVLSPDHYEFPPLDSALQEPNGLLAAGGDLSVERLLAAYQRGIFPWFEDDQPILWWSPDPRCVLFTETFTPSRSLRRTLRKGRFRVTADQDFRGVMEGCAAPREYCDETWITEDMHTAYTRLHYQGYAHSLECWNADQQLVGGIYGVCIGRVFFGESMFSYETDASKVAFATLAEHLRRLGIPLLDCQVTNNHLLSLGAEEIPRQQFLNHLESLIPAQPISAWQPLPDMDKS